MNALTGEERRRKKWLWGCTGGCLAFLVTAAALIILGLYILSRPAPLPPPETFVHPEASGFLFVTVERDDPMMTALAVRLLLLPQVQQTSRDYLGQHFQIDAERGRSAVVAAAPMQLVAVLSGAEGEGKLLQGVAVSVHGWSRFYRIVLGAVIEEMARKGTTTSQYKGATIATTQHATAIAVRRNSFMWARRKEWINDWVDRLDEPASVEDQAVPGERRAPQLDADEKLKVAYERLAPSMPVRFACLNSGGEPAALLGLLPEQPREILEAAGMASAITLSGQVYGLEVHDAALTLFVECADEGSAAGLHNALQGLVKESGGAGLLHDIQVSRQENTLLKIDARIDDLPDKAARLVEHLAHLPREASPESPSGGEGDGPERPSPSQTDQ